MGDNYELKLKKIANQLEELRLEMYPKISDTDDIKTKFSDKLFSLQSQIRDLAIVARYLDYNE